jgi:hypothetical protein
VGNLVLLVIVGSTIWVGIDASGRDWTGNKFAKSTAQWVIGSLFLWIVAFPAYLVYRGRVPQKRSAYPAPAPVAWTPPAASVPPPQVSASKRCPDCAESVRAEARKCRFCGHAFGQS